MTTPPSIFEMEYLPIIEEKNGKLIVKGKIERQQAHTAPPVLHATAVIITILPDGKLLLVDKTEKQRKKGKFVPRHIHIYDIPGGHMDYEDIPEKDLTEGLSMHTFRKCAFRELSEELIRLGENGQREAFVPEMDKLFPLGLFFMRNDHNRECSWVFLYQLEDFGPYASEDTVMTEYGEEIVNLPVYAFSRDEVRDFYEHGMEKGVIISDGIGRVLAAVKKGKEYIRPN